MDGMPQKLRHPNGVDAAADCVGGVDFLTLPSNPRTTKIAPKQTDRGCCNDIEVPWLKILLVIPGQEVLVFLKVKVGFVPALKGTTQVPVK